MIKKPIRLTKKERDELERFIKKGIHDVRLVNRAKILLARDISSGRMPESQESIAERLGINRRTVNHAQNDFLATQRIETFLQRKKRKTPPVPPKITGEMEARIIALACREAPPGCARWTLRLLAEKAVDLQYCGAISHMSISRLLKKHSLNLI